MIIVRNVFTAKPGSASKLAKVFKTAMANMEGCSVRVLTDLAGGMNTVVMEMEIDSLAAWEQLMAKYMSGAMPQEMKDAMAGYNELYATGQREIWQVV